MGSFCKSRRSTHQVLVGNVAIGGDAPVSVQSMCTTPTEDYDATFSQINELAKVGADIVRVAIPTNEAVESLATLVKVSPVPLVADIHFDAQLAIQAIYAGASAVRINPGA